MKKREAGFTLVEMMISIAISMFVLAAALTFFLVSVRQYKVQTKIVETNVEGVLGLELLRQDLQSLGFGLPWNPSALPAYTERPGATAAIAALDDTPNPPRAVVSIDCAAFTVNRSDYLVIKSTRVGMDNAAGKWTTLKQTAIKRTWVPAEENLVDTDYVTVLAVGSTDTNRRTLVSSGSPSTWRYNNTAPFVPTEPYSANIVYGIGDLQPVRPFNRAEYYIGNAASNPPVTVPQRCAPNTGVLVKAVVAHDASGTTPNLLPLLDCVADMQVFYGLDTNADGAVESWSSDISGMTSANIRTQLAEVRVHILAQEGERDDSYRTPTDNIFVGSQGEGRNVDVSLFRNYRWKTYSIVTKPKNLAQ